ncbi:rhodanese-like domain-containing protein [Shewanella putrefaciens]|uniref:rhodanese-like domain-containing protein n=1 Tax=Shewanella putrefaciens TaxID=24 RepID=UPI0021BF0307|nr:rhodanese-like domain-containing protein [Shewanella putrefaciens]UXK10025.1 rhodanese-like domain-containing protein [Shewanella putrefaciens]
MIHKLMHRGQSLLYMALFSLFLVPLMTKATELAPTLAWEKIVAGAMVLDVRTPEEFAEGHLANAVNIPFEQVTQEFMNRGIPKDTPVVLYCRSGRRSGIAVADLVAAGYTQAFDAGAYQSLIEARR